MASDLLKTMFLVVLMFCCFRCGKSDSDLSDSLMIQPPEFVRLVTSTIDLIQKVIHVVQKNVGRFGSDTQLSMAVTDCLDLLDLSMDQLSWTISGSERPNGTGNIAADLKIWLSGALINQDTCLEGFDGAHPHTHPHFKRILTGSLDHITNLINKTLSNVKPPITPTGEKSGPPGRGQSSGRKLISDDKFPNWLRSHDRNLLQAANDAVVPDAVVASDGTGNYSTIKEAIDAAPDHSLIRHVIYIKKGVYKEYIEMSKKKWNIMIVGDGANETIISGNRNFVDGWTTYRSATFAVKGQGFIARDITFENTAGPEKHQAVAFRSDSDLSVLYRCAIRGYQDTLYAHSQRQFYRECQITGTVDFIFGDGAVVFQNCQIQARQGLPVQKNTITAQGRKESVESTGFSIQFCNISVEPDVLNSTQTYLGRPWKLYSRTIIMQSHISSAIRPEGWLEWNQRFALDTLFYAEYMNEGSGANIGARVKWPGYHVLNNSDEASDFTVTQFIIGNEWLPSTGVKYTAGLKA